MWVANREFFYIQMEKYARQALSEGLKNVSDLVVSKDDELYRVLVLHYNRNNQIEASRLHIGVDLAGILRGTHGERRRWVGAEWGGVWWGVSPL